MVRLAAPIVLAEIGWMSMGIVDTIMVGRLPNSAAAIGAVSLGSILFYTVGMFGSGLLLGLDTLVSQSFGAGDVDDCHHSLLNSVYVSLALAPLLMALVWGLSPALQRFGIDPAILQGAIPYLSALTWSTLPLLLYFACRRYLQGMNVVRPVMFALVSANLINLFGNWVLIYGHLGMRAMGIVGSGWATCISRVYMAAVLLLAIFLHDRRYKTGLHAVTLRVDPVRIRALLTLGLPAATQITLELGAFAVAAAMIGKLGPIPLAAHQIAINTAALTYMVPLGISSAAAVRVGQALGRQDAHGARDAGWTALLLGAGFMGLMALVFLLLPRFIVRVYTPDPAVMLTGIALLRVAAFFQIFDGLQTVATGALRGAGDTRTPMVCHLFGYWLVGLPLGYWLCFPLGRGVVGLWSGLCVALILIGIVLFTVWRRKVPTMPPARGNSASSNPPPA
jgi:MATE family multidrug resistance protein